MLPMRRHARRRALVDATMAAYCGWRNECAAARTAYRWWSETGTPSAFLAYEVAVDREELAAKAYASLVHRAGRVAETADGPAGSLVVRSVAIGQK
jgi:hypothetical protein